MIENWQDRYGSLEIKYQQLMKEQETSAEKDEMIADWRQRFQDLQTKHQDTLEKHANQKPQPAASSRPANDAQYDSLAKSYKRLQSTFVDMQSKFNQAQAMIELKTSENAALA